MAGFRHRNSQVQRTQFLVNNFLQMVKIFFANCALSFHSAFAAAAG